MKRFIVAALVILAPAFCLGPGRAFAQQHGHAGGVGGGMGNGMGNLGGGPSDVHGNSSSHDTGDAGTSTHGASASAPSTNPGGVLDHNTHLAAKLEGLLGLPVSSPASLTTLKGDASGFKNFGQFVKAVHVSHNLDIPFAEVQSKMTGPDAVSLEKAIQELRPAANAKSEAKKASKESDQDLKDTEL
jgi:hypothetical protein